MVLVDKKIGAEGSVQISLVGGVLSVKASEDAPGIKVSIAADLPLTYYIDAGAEKLNSPLASSIGALVDGVLKSMP